LERDKAFPAEFVFGGGGREKSGERPCGEPVLQLKVGDTERGGKGGECMIEGDGWEPTV